MTVPPSTSKFRYNQNFRREEGVIVFLAAVSISLLFVVFAGLVLDVTMSRRARVYADRMAVEICIQGTKGLPFTLQALDSVVQQVPLLPALPYGLKLNKIRLFLPGITPLEAGGGSFSPLNITTNSGTSSATLCDIQSDGTNRCDFSLDVTDPEVAARVPSTLWDGSTHTGFIGCEVEVAAKTILASNTVVRGKVVYGLTPKNGSIQTFPDRVLIGIAPEVETFDFDDRLDFTTLACPSGVSQEARCSDGFSQNRIAYDDPVVPGMTTFSENPALSDRPNRLRGCYNLYLAARNTIMQGLVERLARSWFYRNRTTIVAVPPYNWEGAGTYEYNVSSNIPVEMVPHGQDLFASQYVLPYLNFKPNPSQWGVAATPISAGGYLCPFTDCSTSGVNEQDQMLVVSQLRDCFHANGDPSDVNPGFLTLSDESLEHANINFSAYPLTDTDFEPDDYVSRFSTAPSYGIGTEPGSNPNHWSQNHTNFRVNAAELMRIMPSFQSCPHGSSCADRPTSEADFLLNSGDRFVKGDHLGFFRYALGALGAYTGDGIAGIGNVPRSGGIDTFSPPLSGSFSATNNDHVVLFTSKSPTNAEWAAINTLLSDPTITTMSFTVVYAPYVDGAGQTSTENWERALGIYGASNPYRRVIYVGPPSSLAHPYTAANFHDYWESLLQLGGVTSPSAGQLARVIYEHLINYELVL